jgi:hypothetical protein
MPRLRIQRSPCDDRRSAVSFLVPQAFIDKVTKLTGTNVLGKNRLMDHIIDQHDEEDRPDAPRFKRVSYRISSESKNRLNDLAEKWGVNLTEALHHIVMNAKKPRQ